MSYWYSCNCQHPITLLQWQCYDSGYPSWHEIASQNLSTLWLQPLLCPVLKHPGLYSGTIGQLDHPRVGTSRTFHRERPQRTWQIQWLLKQFSRIVTLYFCLSWLTLIILSKSSNNFISRQLVNITDIDVVELAEHITKSQSDGLAHIRLAQNVGVDPYPVARVRLLGHFDLLW